MTLFSLAKKNVTGNLGSYLLYFLSMIFSVVIYYTFVSLQYSEEIQQAIETSNSLLNIFIAASSILILFVAVFIFYSNAFFIRRRKKEIGVYSLLGLKKKAIGKMLFYENLIMSMMTIVIGILFGTVLSRLFIMILLKLLDSTFSISFNLSVAAIINTFFVFMILSLLTSFSAYRLVYRFKLIELFRAEKEGEQLPNTSLFAAILAVVLITFSYWMGFQRPSTSMEMLGIMGAYLVSLISGTYLIFRFLTAKILIFLKKRKAVFYRGMNLIGISQLLYRINGNARTLTVIALLNAFTIGAISVGYSFYYTNEVQTRNEVPFSFSHLSIDESLDGKIEEIITTNSNHPLIGQIDIPFIEADATISNPLLQNYLRGGAIKLVSATTYNEALEILGHDTELEVVGNQVVGIQPFLTDFTRADYLDYSLVLTLPDGEKHLNFTSMVSERITAWSYPDFTVVISDQLFTDLTKEITPQTLRSFEVENEITTNEISNVLEPFADEVSLTTFYNSFRSGLESAALNLFILGFFGLVFLAATGSIIYFKQLSEAHQDKARYDILYKVGVSKKDVIRTIKTQTLFVFGLPLFVGIIHGLVLLKIASNIFSVLIGTNLTIPLLISMTAFGVIYIGFYFITLSSVKKIIDN